MKLYTKEMFLIAAEKCEVSMIDAQDITKYIDEYVTPIELPSDEEIGKEMDKLPFSKHIDDGMFNDGQLSGFELGATWMRDKILNKITMAQQTAVEWLYDNLKSHFEHEGDLLEVVQMSFEQAKEMEKEQIIDAFDTGTIDDNLIGKEYYNNTYV